MCTLKVLPLLVALTSADLANSEPEAQLGVSATAATANVKEVPAGRRLIALPELEYEFAIELQCAPQMQAESLSISIADTRRTLAAAELAGQATIKTSIKIPGHQVSPLAVDGFCQLRDDEKTPATELIVEDAFTAHVSLLCAQEERRSILYAAQALDLNLQCAYPDEHVAPTDQGVSAAPISPTER